MGLVLALCAAPPAGAAPRTPADDQQVVERLPQRRSPPQMRQLQALRQAWRQSPLDPGRAAALSAAYFDLTAAEGDPRWVGHAQAVLAPWWTQADPPPAVRLERAVLQQFNHGFDAARADLQAVLVAQPDNARAWAWRLALDLVQARYADARAACARFAALAPPLLGAACTAQVDGLTGRSEPAAQRLTQALAAAPQAPAEQRLWALTRLAEIEERRGQPVAAEAAFRQALALGLEDNYLQAAHADFLLDQGRAAEVVKRLREHTDADTLLLRLALAARAGGLKEGAGWQRQLAERFDAARQRGDATHEKEEARFALQLLGDVPRALALAQRNFKLQREPADARVLLEAALAARQREAARPALNWLAEAGLESPRLQALARQLEALP